MGRIYDALKRAELARHTQAARRGEPAVVVDESVALASEPALAPAEPAAATNGQAVIPAFEAGAPAGNAPSVLAVVAEPSSLAAERLRRVQLAVERAMAAKGAQTLLVTSPGRGDGKSVIAANLALLFAREAGRRVVLVDGDLRKPAAARLLGVPGAPGVAEAVARRTLWRDTIVRAPWNGLDVLPAGRRTHQGEPVLIGATARALVDALRIAYDVVVIDSPPILAVADTVAMVSLVDAVLLVAHDGHTPREALVEAASAVEPDRLLGMVLNVVPSTPIDPATYYQY